MVYFDRRWDGETGIGRFCRETASRLIGVTPLPLAGNPASPLDCFRLTLFMLLNPRARIVSPGYSAPLLGLGRFILTIHDLNHIDTGYNSGFLKRLYYKIVLRRACRNAAHILTVSEFSRQRIIDWAAVSPERITCVGNGVSEAFLESAKNDTSRNASEGYLLSVGNRKGHKNEAAVVRCLAALRQYPKLRLVFTGSESEDLVSLIEFHGLRDRVEFTGPLTERALSECYRDAAMLVFPSFYEGFGLPAVEAMAVGCPVIASDGTALGEVAGGASLGVEPTNDEAICTAVTALIEDVDLRAKLKDLGLARSRMYSWSRVAENLGVAIGSWTRCVDASTK